MPRFYYCDFCGEQCPEERVELADGMACHNCAAHAEQHRCVSCNIPMYGFDVEDVLSGDPVCSPCYNNSRPKELEPFGNHRTVGYEFEFLFNRGKLRKAKAAANELRQLGRLQHDGSLNGSRHYPATAELATHFGSGEALWTLLETVCSVLNSGPFSYNDSCGMHVHLSMARSTEKQRTRLYAWWRLLEPAIYLLVAPERHQNQFCRPSRRYQYSAERYTALNTYCYRRDKTFEVRLHQITFDEYIIKGWTKFLLSFFDTFTKVHYTQQLCNEVRNMSNREKLLFIMQQTKAPLSLWKYAVRTMRQNWGGSINRRLSMPDPGWEQYAETYFTQYQEAA